MSTIFKNSLSVLVTCTVAHMKIQKLMVKLNIREITIFFAFLDHIFIPLRPCLNKFFHLSVKEVKSTKPSMENAFNISKKNSLFSCV